MVTLAPEEGDLEERIQFEKAMADAGDERDDDEEDSDDEDDDGSALRALLDEEGQPDPAIEASEFLVVSPGDARFLFSQGITYISDVSGWTLLHCLKRLLLLVGCWPLLHYRLLKSSLVFHAAGKKKMGATLAESLEATYNNSMVMKGGGPVGGQGPPLHGLLLFVPPRASCLDFWASKFPVANFSQVVSARRENKSTPTA